MWDFKTRLLLRRGWDPLCLLEFHDRMATSTLKLYQLEKRCMPAFLQSDEAITAIGGYGKRLLLGTNQGRLYRFLEIDSGGRESGESAPSIQWIIESKAELPASTVKDGDAIKQLVCASALGILFCTTGSGSMHTLDLESLEPLDGVGIAKDTPLISLNSHPSSLKESSSDDPFSIQLALVNIRKTQPPRILLAIQHADGERDVWERIDLAKWADYDGTASVRALCYSGHTLCYASEQAYYLRDLKTGSNLKLLNYTLMGAMQPLIVSGGAGQFCFTAPGHLAVFVDERGSSTHPPINLSIAIDVGLELLAMELKGASMLVVLDERECLSLYGLGESKWSETIHCFDDGRPSLLANVEGALLVVTSGGEVGEIVVAPLIPQIEAAITDGRFAEALRMVDYESAILLHIQEVYRGDEEKSFALLYQLRELKTKIAYGCMGVGCEEWSRIRNLLIECEADPSELLARYPELSNHAQGSQRAEAGLPSYAELRDYLEALLSESWAQLYRTKITEGLAKLHYLVGDDNGIAIRAEWNSEELRQWLVDKDRHAEAAKLYCDSGDGLSKALSLWRRLASSEFIDKSFNFDECVEHLRQVPADRLLEKIDELDWLIDSRPKETAELIDAALMRSKPGVDSEKTISKVVEALRSHLATRLDFLERWIHLTNNVSLHNLLFSLMLNALSTEGSGSHEVGRLKLRRFLIGPHHQRTHYDVDYVARQLRSGQLSDPSVELSLLNATESNCVALMEELLGRGKLAAAELLCYKFPSDEALTLLLGNLNSSMCSAESGQRDEACHHKVLSILEAMSTSDFDVAGLIASRVDLIPPDIPSRAFVSRVLLPSVTKHLAAEGENRMRRELTESVKRRNRSRLLYRLSTTSVSLDPDSCCQACHRPLTLFVNAGDSGIAMNPTNGKMFHQQCLDTKHGEERCVP